jgi:hypothetical protein
LQILHPLGFATLRLANAKFARQKSVTFYPNKTIYYYVLTYFIQILDAFINYVYRCVGNGPYDFPFIKVKERR